MKRCNKSQRRIFGLIPTLFKDVLHIPDPGTKHDTHNSGVCLRPQSLKIETSASLPQPAYFFFQTKPIHEWHHEKIHQRNVSEMITANEKYGKVDGCESGRMPK